MSKQTISKTKNTEQPQDEVMESEAQAWSIQLVKVGSLEDAGLGYKTSLSAGIDLCAAETLEVHPNKVKSVKTGVRLLVCGKPPSMYGQLSLRSSYRAKGITDLGVGIIDLDYEGEISVIMFNLTHNSLKICAGDRIAQIVFVPMIRPAGIEVSGAVRGEGGFGSTGK